MSDEIRIVAFDVDGTLIHHRDHQTVWQLLNTRWLASPELSHDRFAAYRDGRITYAEWVDLDIGDWVVRGVLRDDIEAVINSELAAAPGAEETVAELHRRGYRVVVVSGTLNLTIELLLADTVFHEVFTNKIWFHPDGRIRGWKATPFDVAGKAVALKSLSRALGLTEANVAFVGDGWNDITALSCAGLGIAFHAKEDEVRNAAQVVLDDGPLTQLLELLPGVRS
jgi:phosphoserine phosphatase